MSGLNNSSNGELSNIESDLIISFSVRFWLFLLSDILSILCSFFVLYHLLFTRHLRQSLHNHTIYIMNSFLIVERKKIN
jgi:hypothetical protein